MDSIRSPVKRMRTGTPSLCLEGIDKSWRKSFTTDADEYSSPLFRGLRSNCRYPRRRSLSLKRGRFIRCPGYRRVVSENTLDGMRHRRPENRWSIRNERCQQYNSSPTPMSAARGNDHLNNRFKTTPMDRFFFVIYILVNGQTVHYGTHRIPSSTGFKEYIKGKCRSGLLPMALRPVCGWNGIANARSPMVPMKRKRFLGCFG